ncbi:MAG: TIGR01777 family protein [Bacteroidetes bacterium]|nr:TIGR01777 family protein [Bacteroidota bacterium]
MKTILITGGTGFIGTHLTKHFQDNGHTVYLLTRKPRRSNHIFWSPLKKKIQGKNLNDIEIIINLAGEGIANKRWTLKRKNEILKSRVDCINFLHLLTDNFPKLEHFVTVSGIDCYGFGHGTNILTEAEPYGTNFISKVVQEWESASRQFEDQYRTTILRLPIVLDAKKGALPKMAAPIKKWIGAPVGTGIQPMNWVHIDDLTAIFSHVIENSITGTFNIVAGTNTNQEFTQVLAKTLKKPLFLPNVPSFVMKLILGELSELLLNGNYVSGEKLKQTGFNYQFSNLEKALQDIYQ